MSKLQDYVFHYDHYSKKWTAIPREQYVCYWSNIDACKGLLRSSQISTLIEIIEKGEEFIKSIK